MIQDKEALKIFNKEVEEKIRSIEGSLDKLDVYNELMLIDMAENCHDMKGASSMMDLDELKEIFHTLEDVFKLMRGRMIEINPESIATTKKMCEVILNIKDKLLESNNADDVIKKFKDDSRIVLDGYYERLEQDKQKTPKLKEIESFFDDAEYQLKSREVLEKTAKEEDIVQKFAKSVENFEDESLFELKTAKKEYQESIKLKSFFDLLPNFVKKLCRELKKDVDFNVKCDDLIVSKDVFEGIKQPVIHAIRNAMDHGIETMEQRKGIGKSEKGKLIIISQKVKENLVIIIEDDGRGIDIEEIKDKVIEKNLDTRDNVEKMDEEKIISFLFLPGLYEQEIANYNSGRGLGMEIMKKNIDRLKGSIKIQTRPNAGTRIILYVPLSIQ